MFKGYDDEDGDGYGYASYDDDYDDYDCSDGDYDYDDDGFRRFENYAHGRELLAELASQRKTGEFLDLVVKVDSREFPCHRAVLASTPYFKAMLSSNLAEGNSKLVQLRGIDSISFSKILDFLYTGEIRIGNDDVQDILLAAHMLQFEKIVQYCRKFVEDNLCPSNCLGVMRLADMYGFSALELKAKKKAVSHFSGVGQNEEFLSLSLEELLDLLTDEDLKVTDEANVVYSVIRWLDHDPESRKTAVVPILDEIRLSCVKVSALRKLESHAAILESPECLAKITAAKEEHLTGKRQPNVQEDDAKGSGRRGMSNELAIIAGGWKAGKRQPFSESTIEPAPLHSVICLDPDIQQYYHVTSLPTSVLGYMSVACADGRLYVTGGRAHPLVGHGPHSAPSRQAFCYDFASDTWMALPDMPSGRAGHQSVVVDGNLILIGGDTEATSVLSMDCYSLEEGAWMKPPTPPTIGDSSFLTVTALGNRVVLIEAVEGTLGDHPMEVEFAVVIKKQLGYQIQLPHILERKLCVQAFDTKTEYWVKYFLMPEILVEHSLEDVDIFATADHDKFYLCTFCGCRINVYVFDAQTETINKVENRDVFLGNYFRTRMEHGYRYADGQKGIVDSIFNYKIETNRVEEGRQTPLPFALFGHSFLGTKKSSVGWYCRDLEKLEREDEEDKD